MTNKATSNQSNSVTEIENWHHLAEVRDNLDGDYILVNDLDEDTAGYDEHVDDPDEKWEPIGDAENEFTGTFDGQGYKISNLHINRPDESYIGLFGVNIGTIENVEIDDSIVVGNFAVGGLVGNNEATGTISKSSVDVVIEAFNVAAGLVGINSEDSTISDSSITGNVSATRAVGGLVGNNSGEVTESFVSDTNILGDLSVGGLVGEHDGEIKNSYYNLDSVQINGDQQPTLRGVFGGQFEDWLDNDKKLSLEDYPSLTEADGWIEITSKQSFRDALGFIHNPDLDWRLESDLTLTGDDAGLYFPYFAGTLDGDGHTITVDIDLPAVSEVGIVGHNRGTLTALNADGTVTAERTVGGLVGRNSGEVQESTVSDITIGGDRTTGALAGINMGEVRESSVSDGNISGDSFVGGLIGSNNGEVTGASVSDIEINGDSFLGGLLGRNSGEVKNSYYNLGSVQINSDQQLTIGGIFDGQYQDWLENDRELHLEDYQSLAKSDGWIKLTTAEAFEDALGFIDDPTLDWRLESDLTLTGDDAGLYFPYFAGTLDGDGYTITVDIDLPNVAGVGIVGHNRGKITALDGSGAIIGEDDVGCLVGNNSGEVSESSVHEATIIGSRQVGGMVGVSSGEVAASSTHESDITGDDHSIGGLVGQNEGEVTTSVVGETDIAGGSRVGGLVGRNYFDGEVAQSSVHDAEIMLGSDFSSSAGGLVGQNRGQVWDSATHDSDITGPSNVGGLVGRNINGDVWGSWTTADITGDEEVGGLVGRNLSGEVWASWAAGEVTGDEQVGGLIGQLGWASLDDDEEAIIRDAYWDTAQSGESDEVGIIEEGDGSAEVQGDVSGITTDEMQGEAAVESMGALDFLGTWRFVTDPDDYPSLQWQIDVDSFNVSVTDIKQDEASTIQIEAPDAEQVTISKLWSDWIITAVGVDDGTIENVDPPATSEGGTVVLSWDSPQDVTPSISIEPNADTEPDTKYVGGEFLLDVTLNDGADEQTGSLVLTEDS